MTPALPLAWALSAFALALPLSIAGANIGWALVAAALLWRAGNGDPPRWAAARGPLWTPLWLYLAAALASDLLGADPAHSLRYLNQDLHKAWLAALLAVALAEETPAALPAALALSFSAAAVLGTGQAWSGFRLDHAVWARLRAHAFVHPVTYGEQMAVGALGALCALLAPPEGFPERGTRRAAAGLLALLTVALVLSNTRGAMLAFAAGAAAVLGLRPRLRRTAAACVFTGGALYLGMEMARERHSVTLQALAALSHGRFPQGPQFARFTLWEVALRMGLDRPWTGVGVNNYRAVLPRYYTGTFEDQSLSWGTAHNLYLHHFAERGLAGLAALGVLLWVFTRRALERARRRPGFWTLWGFAAAVAFLVMNLSEVALQTEIVWMLIFLIWLAAEADAARKGA